MGARGWTTSAALGFALVATPASAVRARVEVPWFCNTGDFGARWTMSAAVQPFNPQGEWRLTGIENAGGACYMSSAFQVLLSVPTLRDVAANVDAAPTDLARCARQVVADFRDIYATFAPDQNVPAAWARETQGKLRELCEEYRMQNVNACGPDFFQPDTADDAGMALSYILQMAQVGDSAVQQVVNFGYEADADENATAVVSTAFGQGCSEIGMASSSDVVFDLRSFAVEEDGHWRADVQDVHGNWKKIDDGNVSPHEDSPEKGHVCAYARFG